MLKINSMLITGVFITKSISNFFKKINKEEIYTS